MALSQGRAESVPANVVLGPDVDLRLIAGRTPGFVDADLANFINEAARPHGSPPAAPRRPRWSYVTTG